MVKKDKRGQLTLFIVLAILLVVAIGVLFYFYNLGAFSSDSSVPVLESCISKSLDAEIKKLALTAGVIRPKFDHMYGGNNYTFLCYTDDYYTPCVNQVPILTNVFEDSLANILKSEFQACYDSAVSDLVRRGYDVSKGTAKFDISIEPLGVVVNLDAPLTSSSGLGTTLTQKYKYTYKTNLYELLMVATSLIQFETYYGDSEQTTQMFYYPKIIIDKQRIDGEIKVYTLTEKNEDIVYRFAVKSFPWPAGGYL
jgi:hypothetical protein